MSRSIAFASLFLLTLALPATDAQGQERRRSAPPDGGVRVPAPGPLPETPSHPRYPYAGLWRGVRSMPVGSDELHLRFTLENDVYLGQLIHGDGSATTTARVSDGAAGLTWEMPNSGGGSWRYRVRLVSHDSIAGTLELVNAPANLTPPPKGTIAARRVLASPK